MSTSRGLIASWFQQGVRDKQTFLLVCTDTFDWEDYPVFAKTADAARRAFAEHNGKNMQKVMEIYDLRQPMGVQLDEPRAFHLPEADQT